MGLDEGDRSTDDVGSTAHSETGLARLTALANLRFGVGAQRSLDSLLDRVARTATELLPADGGASVVLWDADTERFTLSASTVPDQDAATSGAGVRPSGVSTRRIIDDGTPVVVGDVRDDPFATDQTADDSSLRSYIGVPITFDDERLGVLYAMSRRPRRYSEEDRVFMELVAANAAHAIVFNRQRERLDAALRETRLLLRISRSLMGSNQLDDALAEVTEVTGDVFEADRVLLIGLDHVGHRVTHFFRGGRRGATVPQFDYEHYMSGLTGEVVRTGRTVRSEADGRDLRESEEVHRVRTELGAASILVAPLRVGDDIVGTLTVLRDPEQPRFDDDDLALLDGIAGQAAVAFERARLYSEAQRLAVTDELTGVHNRRELTRLGAMAYDRAARFDRPISALMLDVDHFKSINDEHGHAVGDAVLRRLAERCRATVRQIDVFGRYGGEEFSGILPECDEAEAREVAERMRAAVDAHPFDDDGLQVTVSVGVATHRPTGAPTGDQDGFERLLREADEALLTAKRAGRDRVAVFGD